MSDTIQALEMLVFMVAVFASVLHAMLHPEQVVYYQIGNMKIPNPQYTGPEKITLTGSGIISNQKNEE